MAIFLKSVVQKCPLYRHNTVIEKQWVNVVSTWRCGESPWPSPQRSWVRFFFFSPFSDFLVPYLRHTFWWPLSSKMCLKLEIFQKNSANVRKTCFRKKDQKSNLFSLRSTSIIFTRANSVNFAKIRQKLPKKCQKLAQSRHFWQYDRAKILEIELDHFNSAQNHFIFL